MSYLYTDPDGTIKAYSVCRLQYHLDRGETEHEVAGPPKEIDDDTDSLQHFTYVDGKTTKKENLPPPQPSQFEMLEARITELEAIMGAK